MLVLVDVAALSMLAGYFFKPNRAVISTQPTTQSSAIDKDHCKKAGGEWDAKMNRISLVGAGREGEMICRICASGTPHYACSLWLVLQGFHLHWLSAMKQTERRADCDRDAH